MTQDPTRLSIIEATLTLAAERSIFAVGLAEIAEKAGVTLAELRARYDSRVAILEDFARLIDERLLAGHERDMAGEPPRERLFDVMMQRFDALVPYRPGLKGLRRAAMRDPLFALTLGRIAAGSQRWTLASAGLEPRGAFAAVRGLARAQALVAVTARVMPVFLDDEEAGLPKTMAALDTALKRLDRMADVVTRIEEVCGRICRKDERRTRAAAADVPEGGAGEMAAMI